MLNQLWFFLNNLYYFVIILLFLALLCVFLLFVLYAILKLYTLIAKKYCHDKYLAPILNSTSSSKSTDKSNVPFTVGILHPFCNAGGGGERVLWSAIRALQDTYPRCVCVIYTGDREASPAKMLENAKTRFTIELDPARTHFVYLRCRFLVKDSLYPIFTLLGQSIGSMFLGLEALVKFVPDVYLETTGYAFTYPLFCHLAEVPVCCYVHYPTISTDMLNLVASRNATYNNRALISRSAFLTKCKLLYYRLFVKLYSACGRCSCCVMVNSTWTQSHINALWSLTYRTQIVYPPCDVDKFADLFGDARHDENFYIASVAQFRPEKNHQLQVRAFAHFFNKLNENDRAKAKLLLIGSCRDKDDEQRVSDLRELARALKVQDHVEFKLNFTFQNLKNELVRSAVGIHTMVDEHFGIGVVECMAAGTVMIAHNSAGPKEDIVVPYRGEKTGFLAESEEQFSDWLTTIHSMSKTKRDAIRGAAREHINKFSQENFNKSFLETFSNFCFQKFVANNRDLTE